MAGGVRASRWYHGHYADYHQPFCSWNLYDAITSAKSSGAVNGCASSDSQNRSNVLLTVTRLAMRSGDIPGSWTTRGSSHGGSGGSWPTIGRIVVMNGISSPVKRDLMPANRRTSKPIVELPRGLIAESIISQNKTFPESVVGIQSLPNTYPVQGACGRLSLSGIPLQVEIPGVQD